MSSLSNFSWLINFIPIIVFSNFDADFFAKELVWYRPENF